MLPDFRDKCPDCQVLVGKFHRNNCDVARCAFSGEQRFLSCNTRRKCAHRGAGVDCRTQWSGKAPGTAECREYGWYVYFGPEVDGSRGWQRCGPEHPAAMEDLTRLILEARWSVPGQKFVPRDKRGVMEDSFHDGPTPRGNQLSIDWGGDSAPAGSISVAMTYTCPNHPDLAQQGTTSLSATGELGTLGGSLEHESAYTLWRTCGFLISGAPTRWNPRTGQ